MADMHMSSPRLTVCGSGFEVAQPRETGGVSVGTGPWLVLDILLIPKPAAIRSGLECSSSCIMAHWQLTCRRYGFEFQSEGTAKLLFLVEMAYRGSVETYLMPDKSVTDYRHWWALKAGSAKTGIESDLQKGRIKITNGSFLRNHTGSG